MLCSRKLRSSFVVGIKGYYHVRCRHWLVFDVIITRSFRQHSWCKRHPEVPVFDHVVDDAYDVWPIRPCEDRPVSQRPGPELHTSFRSGHYVTFGKRFGNKSFYVFSVSEPNSALAAKSL